MNNLIRIRVGEDVVILATATISRLLNKNGLPKIKPSFEKGIQSYLGMYSYRVEKIKELRIFVLWYAAYINPTDFTPVIEMDRGHRSHQGFMGVSGKMHVDPKDMVRDISSPACEFPSVVEALKRAEDLRDMKEYTEMKESFPVIGELNKLSSRQLSALMQVISRPELLDQIATKLETVELTLKE